MKIIQNDSSFRDPYGHVYNYDNKILRIVQPIAKSEYEAIRDLNIVTESIEHKYLIHTSELDKKDIPADFIHASYVVQHERVPFISYPYEWTFHQLKLAALHHLDFQLFLLKRKAVLRDASAYNIQFIGSKPIFIDFLSIRLYREGEYWFGYRQFCEQFLNPLLLRSLKGIIHNNFYRGSLDGISVEDMAKLLSIRNKISLNILLHVVLQSKFTASAIENEEEAIKKFKKQKPITITAYRSLLKQIRNWINKLKPMENKKTTWGNYTKNNTYLETESRTKRNLVEIFSEKNKPSLLVDLGCNTGEYSIAALKSGAKYVIGYDCDINAIELAFMRSKKENLSFLPLFLDATNPSPSQGWFQEERTGFIERNKADAVIALAFEHHLTIGNNIPMEKVISWITSIANKGLIEFVPKNDPTITRMLSVREDIFHDYTEEKFVYYLSEQAKIQNATIISESGRKLFEFSI